MGQAWEALMSSMCYQVGAFLAADFQYPTSSILAIDQRGCLFFITCTQNILLQYVHDCGIRVDCFC